MRPLQQPPDSDGCDRLTHLRTDRMQRVDDAIRVIVGVGREVSRSPTSALRPRHATAALTLLVRSADPSTEPASSQRTPAQDAHSVLLEYVHHVPFDSAAQQRVLLLQSDECSEVVLSDYAVGLIQLPGGEVAAAHVAHPTTPHQTVQSEHLLSERAISDPGVDLVQVDVAGL